jgi:hypothetical protein
MRYLLLLLPLMLFGCADSSTTGTNREYDIRVDIRDNAGPVVFIVPVLADATSVNDQITENASDIAPDVRLQLTEGAAQSAMSGADALIKDVVSKYQPMIKREAEKQVIEQLPTAPPPAVEEPVTPAEPEDIPPATPEDPLAYETRFHHTQTAGPDKGKSLVLCPGQTMQFDSCTSDGVKIPWHGYGDGRETYWNMTEEPKGDILCRKGDNLYLYPATEVDSRGFTWGKCD